MIEVFDQTFSKKVWKIQSEHSSDVVRSVEILGPVLKRESVTNLERNTLPIECRLA